MKDNWRQETGTRQRATGLWRAVHFLLPVSCLLSPVLSHAQTSPRDAEGAIRLYLDDDDVTVWSPAARARAPVGPVDVDVGATVDVVTAASIDVLSAASPYAISERRWEGDVAVGWTATRTTTVRATAVGSLERDYRSLHLGAGARFELRARTTTLDLTWTAALDRVGRAGDAAFDRARTGHRLTATLTQVVDRRTYVDLVADGAIDAGYLANPYRYVPVVDPAGARLYSLAERTPGRRAAVAALARVRRAIGAWFGHADARGYADEWGVASATASVRALRPVRRFTAGAQLRGYRQSGARFWRAAYVDDGAGAPAWRTRDRTLGPMATLALTLVGEVALGDTRLTIGCDAIRFWFLDDPLQARRDAVVVTVGLSRPL